MVTLQHELVATLAIADVIVGYDSMDSLIHVVEISESLNVQRIVVVVIIVIIIVVVIVVIVIITLIVIIIVIIVIIIVIIIVLVVTRLVIVAIIVIIVAIFINCTLLPFYHSFSHQFLTFPKVIRCFACIRQLYSPQTPHICSSNHSTIQTPDRECVIVLETAPLRYKGIHGRQIYYDHYNSIQTQKRRDTLLSFVTFKCSHSHNHRLNSIQV